MADPAELRARARLCRLAASTPTTGGTDADHVLLALAERLDRKAVVLEEMDRCCDNPALSGLRD
jgi:hypothetical protein